MSETTTTPEQRIAELEQRVEDLTAVVHELTKSRLFYNGGRHSDSDKYRDLGLRGPAQAGSLMVERGLVTSED